jgi:hypothetical protein
MLAPVSDQEGKTETFISRCTGGSQAARSRLGAVVGPAAAEITRNRTFVQPLLETGLPIEGCPAAIRLRCNTSGRWRVSVAAS